jgi:hypothetical protein
MNCPLAEMQFELVGLGHVLVRVFVNGVPRWFIVDSANHGPSAQLAPEFRRADEGGQQS